MGTFSILILFYPYLYQYEVMIFTIFLLLIFCSIAFGIYRLVTRKMSINLKNTFRVFLKIIGISIIILFFTETIFSLITIHLVNKQLGFNYATPDTPEGELFIITQITPGKIMEKSGLTPGDQIRMSDVDDLYRLIINNQGKETVIPILRDKKKMWIKVKIPKLNVPIAEVSFLF